MLSSGNLTGYWVYLGWMLMILVKLVWLQDNNTVVFKSIQRGYWEGRGEGLVYGIGIYAIKREVFRHFF